MNKILSILIMMFWVLMMDAQNISVSDFHLDEMDQTANLQGTTVLDQNGEKCALIKVNTTQTGFNFDAGSLGVTKTIQKTAQIWVYVPHGVRKLSISHQKFGRLEYQLPVTTQKARTYIMDLKAETPLPVNSQRLTIKCQPKNAVVMIDGEPVDIQNGVGEATLKLGSHNYIAMANGYYKSEGAVKLAADRPGKLTIELDPKERTVVANSETPASSNVTPVNSTETEKGISFTVKDVTFEMIKVDGGTFTMGATPEQGKDAERDEKPAHQVTLSSYYIGKYEVTQALWNAVMDQTVTQIANANNWKTCGVGDNYPMYDISWNDCQTFINNLNELTGKTFRFPTEAEWEYACRGGNKSRGYKYSGSNNLSDVAWYTDNSGNKTHEVGTKQPNELGIYDMSGNVDEWCSDWYGSYSSSAQTNPTGASSGSYRVARGGSWRKYARICRSSHRGYGTPGGRGSSLGLRLALSEL